EKLRRNAEKARKQRERRAAMRARIEATKQKTVVIEKAKAIKNSENIQKSVKRKLSLSSSSADSDEENANNSQLKCLQDGLSQYFTPSNRRKSRNSFTVQEDDDSSSESEVPMRPTPRPTPRPTAVKEESIQSTPKRTVKRQLKITEFAVRKPMPSSAPSKGHPKGGHRVSARKRQSLSQKKTAAAAVTKSPRPVRTSIPVHPKVAPMPISP
ncbi:unnamed protein product, partial [Medioppia subpectinata]